jgi:hypothetical protein
VPEFLAPPEPKATLPPVAAPVAAVPLPPVSPNGAPPAAESARSASRPVVVTVWSDPQDIKIATLEEKRIGRRELSFILDRALEIEARLTLEDTPRADLS